MGARMCPRGPRTIDLQMLHRKGHGVALVLALAFATLAAFGPGRAERAVAASCNGASHPAPTLSSGRASPGSGSPTTSISFSVRYTDGVGCAPTSVEVVISGLGRYPMRAVGTAFASGVTFRFAKRLPSGRWSYRFVATSGSGAGRRSATLTAVSPLRVVIKKPASTSPPKPTPRPTAKSGAKATPRPATTARPNPHSSTPTDPSASPDGQAAVASPRPSSAPADARAGYPGGGPDDPGSGGTAGRDHARLSTSSDLGIRIDPSLGIPVAAWSLTTVFGVLVFALGLVPVRRRADPDSRRWRLSLAGGPSAAQRAAPMTPADPSPRNDAPAPVAVGSGVREPLRFHAPPRAEIDRRTIAYRSVRVADQPDSTTSSEICRLDRGDEIEIIGEHEGFLQVRTPTGMVGWVQRIVIVG